MKKLTCAVLAAMLISAGSAYADDGFSVGASIGYANIENDDPAFDFDANDTGYKFFANYSFANYLGFEGAYIDFGEPSDDVLGLPGTIDAEGYTLYAVGRLPLADSVGLFGKAGVISWDADSIVDGALVGADDGDDLALGFGASWNANGTLGLRAEYEWFDIPDADNVWMASLGFVLRF
jgi:opacity protein-like surface antigen